MAVADALRTLKANSSGWVNEQWGNQGRFAWQTGYAAFSASHSAVEPLTRYIAAQEEHHRRMTFQEEFLLLLRKHGIEYDERYLWD
jgi:hypothetical protein